MSAHMYYDLFTALLARRVGTAVTTTLLAAGSRVRIGLLNVRLRCRLRDGQLHCEAVLKRERLDARLHRSIEDMRMVDCCVAS